MCCAIGCTSPDGLQRMAALSVLAHAAFLAVLLLAPGGWWPHAADEPKTVMTITLGAAAAGRRTAA